MRSGRRKLCSVAAPPGLRRRARIGDRGYGAGEADVEPLDSLLAALLDFLSNCGLALLDLVLGGLPPCRSVLRPLASERDDDRQVPCGARARRDFRDGASRDRTGDLLLAKQALSQLSYGP